MQTELTFSQEDSLANPTQWQGNEKGKKMRDISGQKCLDALEKLSPDGSLARTFSALLIGQEGWYSTKCKLTWKLKGTKYSRMYCQLQPSMLPIEEIEFGLLPTPTASAIGEQQSNNQIHISKDGVAKPIRESGIKGNSNLYATLQFRGLLPTPTTMDSTNATAEMKSSQVKEGSMHSVTLTRAMSMGILPTPQASDFQPRWKTENWQGNYLPSVINGINGTRSQLSPQFVLEMMGFPTDWTLLPFLNGESNP
jgi:hypothetical protein